MARPFHSTLTWILSLCLALVLGQGCAGRSEKMLAPFTETESSPSALLPTLEVTEESCYVHLNPGEPSRQFGPLSEGEKIKWLDAREEWVRVWIPRIRESGWVLENKVRPIITPSDEIRVPISVLSTIRIAVRKANVREGPTTGSPVIAVKERGQEFHLLNEHGGWCQIWLPELEREGWIYEKIITREWPR